MKTGYRGAFVVAWSQVELDGLSRCGVEDLCVGATWKWHGAAVRIDGPGSVLVLGQSAETESLHRHAARAANRLLGRVAERSIAARLPQEDAPVLNHGFSLTDGLRRYTATLVEREDAPPLCMFLDEVPPQNRDLWVSHVVWGAALPNRTGAEAPSVICFTPETRISTPQGPRLAGELSEGDCVLTRDDGPLTVRWIGHRRITGARLHAMPGLRPIRIRAGAVGVGVPSEDLLVSPQHRLLVKGPKAAALFGADEVLVAARDLVDDHAVLMDRRLREVTYIHLLLDCHSIVFANGLEAESFHPATMNLDSVAPDQLARLVQAVPGVDKDPSLYGAFARRMLSQSEAAILRHSGSRPH